MKYFLGSVSDFLNHCSKRRLIFFGTGAWCHAVEYSDLSSLQENVAYCIDNGGKTEIDLWGRKFQVFSPETVAGERNCIVLITTYKYMIEMVQQLEDMHLSDSVECAIYPLLCLKEDYSPTTEQCSQVLNSSPRKIPKEIHTFWFSGEEKPAEYQTCVDSWQEMCPDFQIFEWNLDTYDWHVHPYIEAAIENHAWAAAADFARLDVLYQRGGIYLDADVEVLQSLNPLLGNKAFFSFFDPDIIDLYMFGSVPENPLIRKLLQNYYDVEIPADRAGFDRYYQPIFMMKTFVENGLKLNGRLQFLEDNVFLPRQFLNLQDIIFFNQLPRMDYSFAIHHANGGWLKSGYKSEKEKRNRSFYKHLTGNEL